MFQWFVTGTGTSVGKTHVTCALARRGCAAGQRVFAFKPIETGCTRVEQRLVGSDQEALALAAGDWQRDELRHLYCFEHPLAPLMAATRVAREIDLDHVRRVFLRGAAGSELVLVEGAGGWRVPITTSIDMSGLARKLALPVVVVGSGGLGTINHTLLTVEAVLRDGCTLAGVVLSVRPGEDVQLARANAAEIQRVVTLPPDPALLDLMDAGDGHLVCGCFT